MENVTFALSSLSSLTVGHVRVNGQFNLWAKIEVDELRSLLVCMITRNETHGDDPAPVTAYATPAGVVTDIWIG